MISLEKLKISTPLQKSPKNVRDLGKLIVATCFEKLPKVQNIAQSGHTVYLLTFVFCLCVDVCVWLLFKDLEAVWPDCGIKVSKIFPWRGL